MVFLMFFFFLLVLFNNEIISQYKSIHQTEYEYYSKHYNEEFFKEYEIKSNLPINFGHRDKNCQLNKIVFGWHPYWCNGLESNYDWSLLTDLCYFGYSVDPSTGNPNSTYNWSTVNVVTQALAQGKRVSLCVILFSDHSTFFNSSSAQQTLINNLINLIQSRGAHGVNIDFEGVPASLKTQYMNFLVNLSNQFHSAIPGSIVSIALPSVDWSNVYDIQLLKNYIDLFVIMGYDYYYSGSSQAGPTSPLYSLTSTFNYNINRSIIYYLNAGVPPNKLVIGLPYYGYDWPTSSNSIPSNTIGTGSSRTYKTVRNNSNGYYSSSNKGFNMNSYVPYYIYHNGTEWRQCWIDDAYSFGKKLELVHKFGIAGIGIWALGYDDGYPDLWNKIEEKLTTCFKWNCNDTLYDSGGPAWNYYNNENYSFTLFNPSAYKIRLNFQEFSTEENNDVLKIYDGASTNSPLLGSFSGTNSPGTITSSQQYLTLKFSSNSATTSYGWRAILQCIQDNEPPTTSISVQQEWITTNFTANFTDTDNVGIEKSFYQVLDFDGQYWGANAKRGFFGDNFDNLGTHWVPVTGSWSVANGVLFQTDESLSNTNIYTYLDQTLSNRYLYHFIVKYEATNSTPRFGFHFFSDSASLPNRNNSYFIWFRISTNELEFYKVENDVFNEVHSVSGVVMNSGVYYDIKVTYDRVIGRIDVWVNNQYKGGWQDSNPLDMSKGRYISFRTGNCKMYVNEIKVYRSRYPQVVVTVGDTTKDIRYQNPSPTTSSAKIKSIVVDVNKNLSDIAYYNLNVDWTPPIFNGNINDGSVIDYDTITSNMDLIFYWNKFIDNNSGIKEYYVSIGTQPTLSDVLNWINIGQDTFFYANVILSFGNKYYFNVKSINNAGLESNTYSSDGFVYLPSSDLPFANFFVQDTIVCTDVPIVFYNASYNTDSVIWFFPGAIPNYSYDFSPTIHYPDTGIYTVILICFNQYGSDTLIKYNYIKVKQGPKFNISYNVLSTSPPYIVVFSNQSSYIDSLTWYFGDGTYSNDWSPYHIYNQSGEYNVLLEAKNSNCINSYMINLTLYPSHSFSYNNENDFFISFNEIENILKLISKEKILKIYVFDVKLRELIFKEVNNFYVEININNLQSGIYFVKVTTTFNSKIFKILKK